MLRALKLVLVGVVGLAGWPFWNDSVRAGGQLPTQIPYRTGQNVSPIYEGFEPNDDGSYTMWFGYLNKNYEEAVDLPVGPANRFEPAPEDRGQPTHFLPRRKKDLFTIVVPRNFGNNRLVWTLIRNGRSESVTATLDREHLIDRKRLTTGGTEKEPTSNLPPTVTVPAKQIAAKIGQRVQLSISATDDGRPAAGRRGGRGARGAEPVVAAKATNMTAFWSKYRGPAAVVFTEGRTPVVDGRATTEAVFEAPGTYIVHVVVDDSSGPWVGAGLGGLDFHCCWTNADITVVVTN